MDFEKFSHKLPIKRTTCIKNINLCKVADVNEFINEPEVYLVSKVDDVVKINMLKNVVQTLNREHVYNTGNNFFIKRIFFLLLLLLFFFYS